MTWTYKVTDDASRMKIYDHTGTKIAEKQNDGSGFEIHSAVFEVMEQEVIADGLSDALTNRQVKILKDAIFENIESENPKTK